MKAMRRETAGAVSAAVNARRAQLIADGEESEAAARFRRGRKLQGLLEDAVRRADAFARLDAALRMGAPQR